MKLGKEQEQALTEILKFTKSKKICYTLSGYAGTGKSHLTRIIINELEELGESCTICAPTHKAKIVIERFTGKEGMTIHKLLSLAPNINIMQLDFNDLRFNIPKTSSFFPSNNIIFCDEASMVNDVLFDLMIDRCKKNNCKVIFIGDVAQLKPINHETTSKVFNIEDKIFLTEVFRQDEASALSQILPICRTEFIEKFEKIESVNGSVFVYTDIKPFFINAMENFKIAIENKDILETKILSYTNNRVKIFNDKIHLNLFGENEYYKGEFLTCHDSVQIGWDSFWNGMDYIIVEEPFETTITIPGIGEFPGYKLEVYDSSNKVNLNLNILSRNTTQNQLKNLCGTIEQIRQDAVEAKMRKLRTSGVLWKQYFKIMESFTTPFDLYYDNRLIRKTTFDYGYAMTYHRSQGSTINNTFLDMKSISFCRDKNEKRQLQYVALSRAKHNVNILQ